MFRHKHLWGPVREEVSDIRVKDFSVPDDITFWLEAGAYYRKDGDLFARHLIKTSRCHHCGEERVVTEIPKPLLGIPHYDL